MFSRTQRPTTETFNRTTSKYHITFAGTTIETTVTDNSATATNWVHEITAQYGGRPLVVGLNVEWRPHHIRSMSNKSATLQLCINDKCLILQLFYMDQIPDSIKQFLMNPYFTFAGVEVEDDVKKLREEYGLVCTSCFDVRAKAMDLWPCMYCMPGGLKQLADLICGLEMEKPMDVCKSDWEARVLSQAQIQYACIDAFASYKIGHKLLSSVVDLSDYSVCFCSLNIF